MNTNGAKDIRPELAEASIKEGRLAGRLPGLHAFYDAIGFLPPQRVVIGPGHLEDLTKLLNVHAPLGGIRYLGDGVYEVGLRIEVEVARD